MGATSCSCLQPETNLYVRRILAARATPLRPDSPGGPSARPHLRLPAFRHAVLSNSSFPHPPAPPREEDALRGEGEPRERFRQIFVTHVMGCHVAAQTGEVRREPVEAQRRSRLDGRWGQCGYRIMAVNVGQTTPGRPHGGTSSNSAKHPSRQPHRTSLRRPANPT